MQEGHSLRRKKPVYQSGTFIATPSGAAAGIAGLKEMTKEALGELPGAIHWAPKPVTQTEIDKVVITTAEFLSELKPVSERTSPQLVG